MEIVSIINKIGSKIGRRILFLLRQAGLFFLFIKNHNKVRFLCKASMLDRLNKKNYLHKTCPICGAQNFRQFFALPFNFPEGQECTLLYFDFYNHEFESIRRNEALLNRTMGFVLKMHWNYCFNCKNAFLDIKLPEEHLNKYYGGDYNKNRPIHVLRKATKSLYGKFAASLLDLRGVVLEIGAAHGFAAEEVAKYGHKVYVTELNQEHIKKLKANQTIKHIEEIGVLSNNSIDLVFSHHVLEHIPNPAEFINLLKQPLKVNGLLLIQVPDVSLQVSAYLNCLKRRVNNIFNPSELDKGMYQTYFKKNEIRSAYWLDAFNNDHIVAFTPEGISWLLESCGFVVQQIIQSDKSTVINDSTKYAWPVDEKTGNEPNSMTVIARKK